VLLARNQLATESVLFRFHVAFEREFRMYGVERRNNIVDTRFVRGARMGGGELVLFVLLDGWIHWHDGGLGSLEGPTAFLATMDALAGGDGRTGARSSGGSPYRALELVIVNDPHAATRAPFERISCSETLLSAARAFLEDANDAAVRAYLAESAAIMPRAGALAQTIVDPEPAVVQRIWDSFAPTDLITTPFPSLQALVERAGVSTAHFSRQIKEVMESFHVDWEGWRDLTNDARLRWALLMVSNPALSIADVARASGYASTDVLDATFRRADLPSPSEVRRQILEAVAAMPFATHPSPI
jgi:AraC-like DNA-binding protein